MAVSCDGGCGGGARPVVSGAARSNFGALATVGCVAPFATAGTVGAAAKVDAVATGASTADALWDA